MPFPHFLKFIGRKGIFFERGYVASIEIVDVTAMEDGVDGVAFNMKIERNLFQEGQFFEQEEEGFLKVSSNSIEVEDDIIRSSGYIVWTIVLNETKLDELWQAFERSEKYALRQDGEFYEAYSICRQVMKPVPVKH